jgi:tetratricopeptide (TPR) repeat protein
VFDTGDIGHIWFISSRYVAGPTLSEWLRQQEAPLPANQAADLVAILAEAVHHAHSRGVLHRDLKPANVLLEPNQGQDDNRLPFSPRLSDFGLARRLDDAQEFTQHESLMGTPRYMAPEQAACRHNDVGIQTDVYALGVILYELLTGSPPHASDTDPETLRRIMDDPVPLAPLQQRRVARDLRTVCLKCLQKDSTHRYDTAGALAADLRRFLANEPITARPVGRVERTVQWCRRRPMQATLSAAICLVSAAGVAGITSQWFRAERSLALAKAQSERAEHNLALAKSQSSRAEENLRQLELAFIDLAWVFDEAEFWRGGDDGFSMLLRDKLAKYAGEMTPQYLRNRDIPKPIAATLYAMNGKYASVNGQTDIADENYRKSIDLWREVIHDAPDGRETLRAFAITLFGYARHRMASKSTPTGFDEFQLVRQMFATLKLTPEDEVKAMATYARLMESLGHTHARRGQNEEAIKTHQLANQIWHELVTRSPSAEYRVFAAQNLCNLAARQHRLVRDFPGALSKTHEARALLEEAVQLEPAQRDWQFLLAGTLQSEANFTNRVEGSSAAIPIYERSVDIYRNALANEPADSGYRGPYADVSLELAALLLDARGPEAALPLYEACAENWQALNSAGALSHVGQGNLAMVYIQLGKTNDRLGQSAKAIAAFQQSVTLATKLRESPRGSRKADAAFIESNCQLGNLFRRQGKIADAVQCFRQAVDELKTQSALRPNNLDYKEQLKAAQVNLTELERIPADKGIETQ